MKCIAAITLEHLMHGVDRKIKIGSWGACDFCRTEITLTFRVEARRYRGMILISYDQGNDLYNIHFPGQWSESATETPKIEKGIHCEALTDVIDALIEARPPKAIQEGN